MTATEWPRLARVVAAVEPAGPAPTIMTSTLAALIADISVSVGLYQRPIDDFAYTACHGSSIAEGIAFDSTSVSEMPTTGPLSRNS